jgi:hypothetical protein
MSANALPCMIYQGGGYNGNNHAAMTFQRGLGAIVAHKKPASADEDDAGIIELMHASVGASVHHEASKISTSIDQNCNP